MTRISPEEKRREAADWFKGLIGITLILSIILTGYFIYQATKNKLVFQKEAIHNNKTSMPSKPVS